MVIPIRLRARTIACCLALMLIMGCERAPVEEGPSAPAFSELQTDIFSAQCTRCHAGSSPPAGLNLTAGNAYDNLVGTASTQVSSLNRVEPGSSDDSYLIIKLEGGPRMAQGTQQMPLGASPLSDDEIDRVRRWISEGAPEN